MTDVEDIIGLFTATYKQHESLYDYIDKISRNITGLEGDIKQIKSKIINQKDQNQNVGKMMTSNKTMQKKIDHFKSIINTKTNKI